MIHRTWQPDGWPRPRGYANGIAGYVVRLTWYVVNRDAYLAGVYAFFTRSNTPTSGFLRTSCHGKTRPFIAM